MKMRKRRLLASVIYFGLESVGIDILKMRGVLSGYVYYIRTYLALRRQRSKMRDRGQWRIFCINPRIHDRQKSSGRLKGHYFHQDLWVAQQVFRRAPESHLDVGSRIDGFVAHVAAFRNVDVMDIRPNESSVENIRFVRGDITSPPPSLIERYDSVSCLHVLEHLGLGRYGDAVDVNGPLKGIEGLARVTKRNGVLYLSVPIGEQRIEFNAHRVFRVSTVMKMLENYFELERFVFVDDWGDLRCCDFREAEAMTASLWYGCGIFEARRRVDM